MAEQGRAGVLRVLRDAGSAWVSGEELSRALGVSRTAIWKGCGRPATSWRPSPGWATGCWPHRMRSPRRRCCRG